MRDEDARGSSTDALKLIPTGQGVSCVCATASCLSP